MDEPTTPRSSIERAWEGEALRKVDTSLRTLIVSLAQALGGLTMAYLVARWLSRAVLHVEDSAAGVALEAAVHVVLAGTSLFLTSARPIRRDLMTQRELVRASEADMLARVEEQDFQHDLQEALEMGETERDAVSVAALALAGAAPAGAELLVADASRAHLRRVAEVAGHEPPGCGVETPWGCPAVRRGRTLRFDSSEAMAACPRLADRGGAPTSAVCVPITILGTPTAVIHATAPVGGSAWSPEVVARLEGLAVQVGSRLGMLRAMAKSQLQAETDPLTGLLNRRAMEEQVRVLRDQGSRFALAMADLDHFKRVNDSFGHDTGDRALRTFARVMREAVRDADIVSRHGGEEFVILLPGLDALTATPVLHRLRERLREAVGTAQIPSFTVSIGVADSTWSDDLVDVLRAADRALLDAKAQGRDCLVIADPVPDPTERSTSDTPSD